MIEDEKSMQVSAPRKSLLVSIASKYEMEPKAFEQTIRATLMPSGVTTEQLAAFLLVAHQYDLNPITKEIYAFPASGGGITPVVGIDGWLNLAQRRHEFDGMDFGFAEQDGKPYACTCRLYRKDRSHPTIVTEYMDECRRPTDPWKSHPRRMLRHKAAIQAIRYAFGFSGIKDEDDAETIYANATVIDGSVSPSSTAIVAAARNADTTTNGANMQEDHNDIEKWPQQGENGMWTDSRGVPFMPEIHSLGAGNVPTVRTDGTFRMRRGCDQAIYAAMEEEALEALKNEREPNHPQHPEEDLGADVDAPNYPEVRESIFRAVSADACDAAEELLRAFRGPAEHKEELADLLKARRESVKKLTEAQ